MRADVSGSFGSRAGPRSCWDAGGNAVVKGPMSCHNGGKLDVGYPDWADVADWVCL